MSGVNARGRDLSTPLPAHRARARKGAETRKRREAAFVRAYQQLSRSLGREPSVAECADLIYTWSPNLLRPSERKGAKHRATRNAEHDISNQPGPYIVEVVKAPGWDGETLRDVVYREAFATLEEARAIVESLTDHRDNWRKLRSVIAALPESGGSVTLSKWEVIEVEATTYYDLLIACANRPHGNSGRTTVLAAWNAEHGIGIEGRA